MGNQLVEERILDLLIGLVSTGSPTNTSRDSFRSMLKDGLLDSHEVEVDVPVDPEKANIFAISSNDGNNPNISALTELLSRVSTGRRGANANTERKKMPISEARQVILDIELERLLENIHLKKGAITAVEESGTVFIDKVDTICSSRDFIQKSADASSEGVQHNLLPLIEGTTISTKYGNINTDYILFIASGAFHSVKPSDMLPELQGCLPIRVQLNALTEEDLYKILTEPVANLILQEVQLIVTEGMNLSFDDNAIREMARLAAELNHTVENIGARRLHTVIEKIMEQVSFNAAEMESGSAVVIDKKMVQEKLSSELVSNDISKYIL